ncbi:hypothetical protein D9M69_659450 [compost metagenome]
MAFVGIQAVDAETAGPGGAQRMHRAPVEQQAAGQFAGRIMAQRVSLEHLAGVVVTGAGGDAENVQQAGLQQGTGMGWRLAEAELADERIKRHVDTPQ